jgi:DNA helicase HerA-like ATPase
MATTPSPLLIAKGKGDIFLLPKMANRHGLIAGATGTGKTVTLRVLAEQFSAIGVPIFMADVKGDLSGLPFPGGENPKVAERVSKLGLKDFSFENYPVTFWDVFGEQGHPVRTTISEMGPLLLSRILSLNEIQSGVLSITFKIADDNGLLLLDLKDLRAMAQFVGNNAEQFKTQYGNISAASIGAIQRGLLTLEEQGGDKYFGEPALNIEDLMQTGPKGKGMINILTADKLMQSPRIYATFLLWLLSELFEQLPEVGDPEKPKLVFFFDEAHLLFEDVPKALEEKIEQVVRLIRSKGVGVYFITQNPLDLPETVLGQLGNRVQHALRAFTPKDQKSVKVAAETFRANPKLNVVKAITELGVGEALVSVLDEKGTPTIVERALIYPPHSRLSPLNPEERTQFVHKSVLYGHYEKTVDRESAYEKLKAKAEQMKMDSQEEAAQKRRTAEPKSQTEQLLGAAVKSAAHAIGSQLGRQIIRGVLGSIFGGGRRR